MKVSKIAVVALILAFSIISCKKSGSKIVLDSDTFEKSKGFMTIKFSAPVVNSTNNRHWVCIVKQGSPDSTWGSWLMVPDNATQMELRFKEDVTEGKYEVRLHSDYPTKPHNVIERIAINIR
jgi:hypothetical protein